ncbi:orotidine-5'-phosphate decarboxylase [Leifsonia sp. AK011]|uniref:orotidine-5'-phosphate decarboxylase n=1 Tax=Leifsonia sp. AK011 TaxID=2723075 RepID=UPI0015CA812A|nr:orotidine-5'-phosphate decarboxylase [Leifsonia sp. AK011]NYF10760.1 orotidine-5'-phosphate decarboxylase [Leifsonia sp. AK011]
MVDFGARLESALGTFGQICLGIDPHPFLLEQWGLDDTAEGAQEFGLRAVDAAAGSVGVVKPQVAFFERHGGAGILALEQVVRAARDAGLLVIADAKRGDIGSTVEAYGQAWLSPGSPLEADAMTVVAYQGVESLRGVIDLAGASGKGLFILAATSNPEALATQTAEVRVGLHAGATVARQVVDEVGAFGTGAGLRSVGVVIGGNLVLDELGLDPATLAGTPILAPGYGEQGASLTDIAATFGVAAPGVIANVGRGVLKLGPQRLSDALLSAVDEVRGAL